MCLGVVLVNPKYVRNLASVVRAAACFGVGEIRYTGRRADWDAENYERVPRELRMKAYSHVQLEQDDYPLRHMRGVPVAIEVCSDYIPLPSFVHPEDAIYVFGPEDGSLTRAILSRCHHFVTIPSEHCLNLAMAVNVVLYDRVVKNGV